MIPNTKFLLVKLQCSGQIIPLTKLALVINTQLSDVKMCPLIQGDTSCCDKPPVDFKTKFPFWPGLYWPSQAEMELLF